MRRARSNQTSLRPVMFTWLNFRRTGNAQTCCLVAQRWGFFSSPLSVVSFCGWGSCPHELVVALRFILVLLIATSGLLLLYQHLGTRQSEDSTGSVGSSPWGGA